MNAPGAGWNINVPELYTSEDFQRDLNTLLDEQAKSVRPQSPPRPHDGTGRVSQMGLPSDDVLLPRVQEEEEEVVEEESGIGRSIDKGNEESLKEVRRTNSQDI